jgi:hypothetical protein
MGLVKKTTSLHETFTTAQVDTSIITPSNNDYVFIWSIIVEAEGAYTISFPTSGLIIEGIGGVTGAVGINKQGEDNEDVKITCDANTTIRIMFDEV